MDADGRFSSFALHQEAHADHPKLRPHRIAIGFYDRTDSGQDEPKLARRRRIELDIAGAVTEVTELIGAPRPALILVNDDDLTYAKMRLDSHSLQTAITSISELADPLAAALCWASAWDMTRDAEMRTRDFLALVASGAPSITELTVLGRLLRMTGLAVRRYTDPAWRAAAIAQLDDALRGWLLTAEPGSDHQLAYAKGLADVATSRASLDLLAGLLAGTESIDGLAVDTDLRWALLHRLVSRGAAGAGDVEAELARDRTDAGERQAESCLAAMPTPEAKAAAWAKITGGALPNATFRAVLRGFRDPDQDELLAPYAARFYDALAGMWQDGASDMAQFFAEVGYPDTGGQQSIDATDAYIAATNPVPALRRLLIERRDDVARALRCQLRDAQAG